MRKLVAIFIAVCFVGMLGGGSAVADPFTLCAKDNNGKLNRGALGTEPAKGGCKNDKWQAVTLVTEKTPETETVSFGQWLADPEAPLNRFAANPPRGAGNIDDIIPGEVVIKQGGSVNFIVAGLHNLVVYQDGTQPEDINTEDPLPGSAGGIIDDPNGRVYWGQNPNRDDVPRDRVAALKFPKPGRYLVICAVFNHFTEEQMWGFVTVLPQT